MVKHSQYGDDENKCRRRGLPMQRKQRNSAMAGAVAMAPGRAGQGRGQRRAAQRDEISKVSTLWNLAAAIVLGGPTTISSSAGRPEYQAQAAASSAAVVAARVHLVPPPSASPSGSPHASASAPRPPRPSTAPLKHTYHPDPRPIHDPAPAAPAPQTRSHATPLSCWDSGPGSDSSPVRAPSGSRRPSAAAIRTRATPSPSRRPMKGPRHPCTRAGTTRGGPSSACAPRAPRPVRARRRCAPGA